MRRSILAPLAATLGLLMPVAASPAPAPAAQTGASPATSESAPPGPLFDLVRIGQASDGSVFFLDLASLHPGPQPTVLVVTVYPQDRPASPTLVSGRIPGGGASAWSGSWSRTTILCDRHVRYMGGSAGAFDANGRFGMVLISSGMNATIEAGTPEEAMWAAACDNHSPAGSEHLASLQAAIRAARAPVASSPEWGRRRPLSSG